ncbi:putative YkwD family protein [Caldalkalibacillus uzonensis]|uniref:YkwD family protein n=1 Tax=Caldalkalibacillus uzonensis TaxID=353224 RepID=A0ABU0CY03_9BACI|nr:CAP domain-containing protein [Caldalkalibacillus uzonensis]MDQ0341033.1 putative YkwD family protein [Caldalkalibacillus uzonensis]
MNRKLLTVSIASLLFLMIVACTNAGDQAQDIRIIDEDYIENLRADGLQAEGIQARGQQADLENTQGQMSSECTTIPSDQFPHTQAVPIQHAIYDFIIVDGQQQQQPQPQQPQQPQAPANEQRQQPAQPDTTAQPDAAEGISQFEAQVIELTNAERRRNGLPDLQTDSALSKVAQVKSNDMQQNRYFSHTSPTYGSPFDMIRDFGIDFNSAGENIAQGQPTPEQVVQAWMNSPGHRANILNEGYTHIGVGHNENGHYWTQMFISR